MSMMDEEACRKYIIVFGAPCPCETDHEEMSREEALTAELKSAFAKTGNFEGVAAHLMQYFDFVEKKTESGG